MKTDEEIQKELERLRIALKLVEVAEEELDMDNRETSARISGKIKALEWLLRR